MTTLKIAKDGFDAQLETDPRNFKFNAKNVPKIAFSEILTVNYTGVADEWGDVYGEGEVSFLHNLGYVPLAFVFSITDGIQIPYFFNFGAGTSINYTYRVTATRVYVTVIDTTNPGANSVQFKVQIMYDKII